MMVAKPSPNHIPDHIKEETLLETIKQSNLILIGMPAVGKSTVGVLLAKHLGCDFIDTDLLIQKKHGRLLQQLIREQGMERFLDLEAQTILGLEGTGQVIATGGSVVYRPRSMRHLQAMGTVVFMDIDLESLRRRLTDMDGRGVVRAPGQSLATLFAQRQPLYKQYSLLTVATAGLRPGQVANKIIEALANSSRG